MDHKKVEEEVIAAILHSQDGGSTERPKLDFKSQWPDLRSPRGQAEFCADVCSMSNTPGPMGLIVVGFNDKDKTFQPAHFSDCNLSDESQINQLLTRKAYPIIYVVTWDFNFDGNALSLISIPENLDQPVVISNHPSFDINGNVKFSREHLILVRKGTSKRTATRFDLDLMYSGRRLALAPPQTIATFRKSSLRINGTLMGWRITLDLSIENKGDQELIILEAKAAFEAEIEKNEKWLIPTEFGESHKGVVVKPKSIIQERLTFSKLDTRRVRPGPPMGRILNHFHSQQYERFRLTKLQLVTNHGILDTTLKIV